MKRNKIIKALCYSSLLLISVSTIGSGVSANVVALSAGADNSIEDTIKASMEAANIPPTNLGTGVVNDPEVVDVHSSDDLKTHTEWTSESYQKSVIEKSNQTVAPNSEGYIEVSTEDEFRTAVEEDNGINYIKLKSDIKLRQGTVTVPSSKMRLTIDGKYEKESGGDPVYGQYRIWSAIPSNIITDGLFPGQTVPASKQKMLYVDNASTKEIIVKDVIIQSTISSGIVEVNDTRDDISVTLDNVAHYGGLSVINKNGVVNFVGNNHAKFSDQFPALLPVTTKSLTESNVVNVLGDLTVTNKDADDSSNKTLFRTYSSNGFSPHITVGRNASVKSMADSDSKGLQSFVESETYQTALTLMKGSTVDVFVHNYFNDHNEISNLIVDEGATLKVQRSTGEKANLTKTHETISVAKGAAFRNGSRAIIENDQVSDIRAAAFEVGLGGSIDILKPEVFDVKGMPTERLFSYPSGAGLLNIHANTSLNGWDDNSMETPTYSIEGPMEAQYSMYLDHSTLISSSIEGLENLYPLENLHRLVVK